MADHDQSTIGTIRHLRRRDPFTPFNIVMASGDRYLIENPDALAIAGTQVHYYPRTGMGVHLRSSQITAVVELDERPAA